MNIKEVLNHIKQMQPLNLTIMIEINQMNNEEKLLIIEEYDDIMKQLLYTIQLLK